MSNASKPVIDTREGKRKPNPRWHQFKVRVRKGRWVAVYPHWKNTKTKHKNGKAYEEPVECEDRLKRADGTPAQNEAEAHQLADLLYDWLEEQRIKHRKSSSEDGADKPRFSIHESLEEWFARDTIKPRTQTMLRLYVRPFLAFLDDHPELEFLDEITFQHGEQFRQILASMIVPAKGESKPKWARATADSSLIAVRSFFQWCKDKTRLPTNPFTDGKLEGFGRRPKSKPIRYRSRHERAKLLAACKSTQEKLIFALTTYAGLRNAEAVHLMWGDYFRKGKPPELYIRFSEPDEDDPSGWDPKTGERSVQLYWPESVELLEQWWNETPFGRENDDPILCDPQTGSRYAELPVSMYRRIRRETEIEWTPQIGRRTACTLMVVCAERLTGRAWSQIEHEQYFGHSAQTARDYYFANEINRIRQEETEISADAPTSPVTAYKGLDLTLAKTLFHHLLATSGMSRNKIAISVGLSFNAVKKFLAEGQSVPDWYWEAIRVMVAVEESDRKQSES